jgi:hypothetical protein
MKTFLFLFTTILCNSISFAQPGFLGSTITISAYGESTFQTLPFFTNYGSYYGKIEKVNSNTYKVNKVIFTPKFGIEISKAFSEVFQLVFSIDTRQTYYPALEVNIPDTISAWGGIDRYHNTESIKFQYQNYNLNFNFFTNGIAPIGKYLGFNITLGQAKLQKDIYSLTNLSNTEYFWSNKIIHVDNTNTTSIEFKDDLKVTSFLFKFSIGNSIPITQKLGLDFRMSIPLIKFYKNDYYTSVSIRGDVTYIDTDNYNINSQLSQNMMFAMRKSDKLSFKIALKYFL